MKSFVPFVAVVVLIHGALLPSNGRAQDLSTTEAALLSDMDSKTIADVLDLVRQLDGWRQDISRLRKGLDAASKTPNDPKAVADATDAVLKIARRLQTCSPYIRKQIGFDDRISPLLKRLQNAAKVDLSPDDFPDVDIKDLRAIAQSLGQGNLAKQIADALDKGILDRIKSLGNPARFAQSFIESQLKKQFFDNPYTVAGFTFQITQKDFLKSVFSKDADIAIVVVHNDTGLRVKAHGLYFKYNRPIPVPVTDKLKLETPDTTDLLNLIAKYLPKVGPISIDKDVPITVTPGKDGKGSVTHCGIRMDFSNLQEIGLGALSVKVKVGVDSSGRVIVEDVKAKAKVHLPAPVPLGDTSLLITSVIVGLPAQNKVELGLTISTVAGEEDTLSADITATIGFPIAKEGVTLDGNLFLNKEPLAHVTGTMNKTGLTVSMDSDAITGGTGKLTIKGTLTKQGLDASAQFNSLFGLVTAGGTLHLGTDGNGSISVSANESVGVAQVNASLSSSFTPGFKNIVFKGAVNLDLNLPDDYLSQVTAEVDFSGQLLPSPVINASGNVGPLTFQIRLPGGQAGGQANFNDLVDALKQKLLDSRQHFYDWMAETEGKASKYVDQRSQVFAGWIYQNAKNIGIDSLRTPNPEVNKALGELAQGLKDGGGTVKQLYDDAGKYASDKRQQGEDTAAKWDPTKAFSNGPPPLFLTSIQSPRSAKLSSGTGGGFGLRDFGFDAGFDELEKSLQSWEHFVALSAQLAPLTNSLDQIVVNRDKSIRDKSNKTGQVAGLRMRTYRVLPHPNGDHDADISFLVQVTSYRYTIDPKKGPVGGIQHKNSLYIAAISLHNLVGKGQKPTAQVNFPTFDNVSPWDAAALLRDELMKRIDAKLGLVQLTDRFEERRLFLHNLTKEPITGHVQIESKTAQGWHWLPAGPGSSLKSLQVTVPAGKIVPVTIGPERVAQGRRARIWASAPSGAVWTPYASKDVVLVSEKAEGGQTSYYANAMQNYRFWFAPSAAKPTSLHERLVSVRNNTRYPILLTAEVAVHKDHDKVAWEAVHPPTRIPPESTVPLHYLHNLPLRGAAIRFQAEDEKKQSYRWISTAKKPSGEVDVKGYSAAALGTTLLVLEPPERRSTSTGGPTAPNVTIHFPAEQVMLPAVKSMPLQKAKKLLEEKGFHVVADHPAADFLVDRQEPNMGWERFGATIRLTTRPSGDSHLKTILVPDFKGMPLTQALAEGQRHQLIVKSKNAERIPVQPTKDSHLVGKTLIVKQEPAAETKVEPKTTVEVFLVRYVPERSTTSASGEHVLVPNFKGQLLATAEAEGQRHHLSVKPKNARNIPTRPTKDPRLVGRTLIETQEPAAGTNIKPETVIEVSLIRYVSEKSSTSPSGDRVQVPSFKEMTLAQAVAEGQRHQLIVKSKNAERIPVQPTKDSRLVGKTLIVKQEPAAETKVEPKTTVEVFLVRYVPEKSTTSASGEHVLVPNFKDQLLAKAETEGQNHHLIIKPKNARNIPTQPTKDPRLVGRTLIETQEPPAGTNVKPETVIEVLLVRYVADKTNTPTPDASVLVPNFKGMSLAQAEAEGRRDHLILRAKNAERISTQPTKAPNLVGKTVIDKQEPAAGTRVKAETVIEVLLVRYVAERSTTPQPETPVVVPNFKEMTLVKAEAEGSKLRLIVRAKNADKVPSRPTKNRALVGMTVIESQQQAAGNKVSPNTVIEVTLVHYVQDKSGK